jgi:hypothetical protein
MMNTPSVLWLKSLTDRELATWAQLDARYQVDPLYTELALRVARHPFNAPRSHAEPIDVRS